MTSNRVKRPKTYSWELPVNDWTYLPPEEGVASDAEEATDRLEPDVWGEEAGVEFINYLLGLHQSGQRVSARAVCTLSHWAYRAGAQGPPGKFGYRPSAASTNFQKHLDSVLGMDTKLENFFCVDTPMCVGHEAHRIVSKLPVLLILEELEQEIKDTLDFDDKLDKWIAANRNLQKYCEHEVVLAHPDEKVHPIAMYLDQVPTTNRDGALGIWIYSLVTLKRHLFVVLRKSDKCNCGCLGWCTLWPIFNYVKWCLVAGGKGYYSESKDNGAPFQPLDVGYASQDSALSYPLACLHIKADESENAGTMAFPSWKSATHPCRTCHTSAEEMHDVDNASCFGLPWEETTPDDVEEACKNCEICVTLDAASHAKVSNALMSDKRPHGNRGRCLIEDMPELGLCEGDRLEPSVHTPDVFAFSSLTGYPLLVVFWRTSRESIVRHRNPLWSAPGVSNRSLNYDLLHILYLGVLLVWSQFVFWACFEANMWSVHAGTQAERDMLNIQECGIELKQWYRTVPKSASGKPRFTEVGRFDILVGTRAEKKLGAKVAECKGLFFFLLHILEKYQDRCPAWFAHIRSAGQAMANLIDRISQLGPGKPSAADVQFMMDAVLSFLRGARRVGVSFKPKFHFLVHLVYEIRRSGDPKVYSTFNDESLNKELGAIGQFSYAIVWHQRLLLYMRNVLAQKRTAIGKCREWLAEPGRC